MKKLGNVLLLFSLIFIFIYPSTASNLDEKNPVPNSTSPPEEIFLSFNYQNLFNKIVIALHEDGQYYLPVSEIFTALKIPHEVGLNPPVISGSYLETDNTFRMNFSDYEIVLDNKGSFSYDASKMLIRETDFYVTPEILSEIFDLEFSVDFSNLVLNLSTSHELPVAAEFRRAQERNRQRRFLFEENLHPLEYDRNRNILAGGFLDYSLSSNINNQINSYTYNTSMGIELLGGDLQGNAFGNFTKESSTFTTNNFRWRYAWRENNHISKLILGQTSSDGLNSRRFRGIRITNEPVEPRYIFDQVEIEGDADPGSEVELYFNDILYDFQEITQNGQYRFLAPISYGNSRLRLRIYNPAGDVRDISRRIQIPHSFLPEGNFEYHANIGQLDNNIFGSTEQSYLAQGDIGYGISKTFTQKIGIEYMDQFADQTPIFYSTSSVRLFQEHLLSFDAAPTAFYRISANAIYPSSTSWDLRYTNFRNDGIYNVLNNDHEFVGNFYLPFSITDDLFSGIRFSSTHTRRGSGNRTRFNIDLNSRINRLNLRFSYSDIQTNGFDLNPTPSSEIRSSATYTFGRNQNLNTFLRGTLLRGNLSFNPVSSRLIRGETQIARNIFENGRLQAGLSRNFLGGFNLFTLSLSIDFNNARLSTRGRTSSSGSTLTQDISGSIGYDNNTEDFVFSNRQQVGRAATSVRLYVDNNNSGTYDSGDEIIKNNAVRIGRSSTSNMKDNGTTYLSQLQPYSRMNMEINKSAIQNPLLVPRVEQFSIVTDPNQYKPINIPFYVSGVISGQVQQIENDTETALSGLRLYLSNPDGSFSKEMQTFSDGSFYTYEIPPGKYELYIDEKQLTFLDAVAEPDTMQIVVEARAEGDFIEDLNFTVKPKSVTANREQITEEKKLPKVDSDTVDTQQEPAFFQVQLASFQTLDKSQQIADSANDLFEELFFTTQNTNINLHAIRSAPFYEQDNILEKIKTYHEAYPNAAVVFIDFRQQDEISDTLSIILGSFEEEENARDFANTASTKLDKEVSITFNTESNRHNVYLEDRFPASAKEIKVLAQILTESPKRPLNFSFQIYIEGATKNVKESLSTLLSDYHPDINLEQQNNLLILEQIPTWNMTKELEKQIKGIPEIGYPIIVLKEMLSTQ